MGFFQHALKTAEVALIHPRDGCPGFFFVSNFLKIVSPLVGAVPKNDAEFIRWTERAQHALRTIPRHLIAVGKFHPVHHQHHRARR